MSSKRKLCRIASVLMLAACLWAAFGHEIMSVDAAGQQADSASTPADNSLTIKTDSNLPDTHPGAMYRLNLETLGGTPKFRWRLERGILPSGINLSEDGVISGVADRGGEYQFTLSVRDSTSPPQIRRKDFTIHVRTALSLVWKSGAHVNGNRIDGSVEVSNATKDEIDLTYYVLAVAANGRATAIGYQHFSLPTGTVGMELPFGDTLPPGGYVVHVDAVGEVAARNIIYREHLQTLKPLHITVGP